MEEAEALEVETVVMVNLEVQVLLHLVFQLHLLVVEAEDRIHLEVEQHLAEMVVELVDLLHLVLNLQHQEIIHQRVHHKADPVQV